MWNNRYLFFNFQLNFGAHLNLNKNLFYMFAADGTSDEEKAESASSSSSVLAEPACAQLLNHRNVYQHMGKDEEKEAEVNFNK